VLGFLHKFHHNIAEQFINNVVFRDLVSEWEVIVVGEEDEPVPHIWATLDKSGYIHESVKNHAVITTESEPIKVLWDCYVVVGAHGHCVKEFLLYGVASVAQYFLGSVIANLLQTQMVKNGQARYRF
jgi:hypothetical protein